ncbi:hypothetical protein [Hydrogenispora ethanolica]|uniref:hypothetical protein n=1 Tax=Hydrogenispora ethanolica TaxID=1082276 RepID=UPI00104DFBC7|nr:hypothetical protein [Hydrogenispora ethanolica]
MRELRARETSAAAVSDEKQIRRSSSEPGRKMKADSRDLKVSLPKSIRNQRTAFLPGNPFEFPTHTNRPANSKAAAMSLKSSFAALPRLIHSQNH